jgi:hypothetical protein
MSEGNVATMPSPFFGIIKKRWRGWLRAIHRDVGYLAVGLTFIYALSGLAINHIKDWDPNFHTYEKTVTIPEIDPTLDDDAAVRLALQELEIDEQPRSSYRAGDEIRLDFDDKNVAVIGDQATINGHSDRFFFRIANWLHYNRGKKAWTYVADAYAVLLLYLACSGLFMLKGRLGLRWRGTLLVALGAAVPLGYVIWSGGPNASTHKDTPTAAAPAAPEDKEVTPPAPTPSVDPSDKADEDDPQFARPKPRVQPPH